MRGPSRTIWRLVWAATGVLGLVSSGASGAVDAASPRVGVSLATRTTAPKPNIVLILTDDQRGDTLSWMPNVQKLLVARGVTFTNAFVPNSLCCPSRTSILTGKYSHATGVWGNKGPHGGFPAFHQNGSTIATWLHQAGYHSALVGKYLNQYGKAAHQGYVPPGWDRWIAFAQDNSKYYDYDLTLNGRIVHRGHRAADYATDVLANKAAQFIRQTSGRLFLYFAPPAPHYPFTPAPQDTDACRNLPAFRPPSFGERDVSDKPTYVRNVDWTSRLAGTALWSRRGQCKTLVDVDRAVVRIVGALSATHRLANTMIVFMSDNGYQWGEHRLVGKAKPYEESGRVPMVIRYDRVTSTPRQDRRLVLNIDLAPTFAALAGVGAPGAQGRNLMPLVRGESVQWRSYFLLEHMPSDEGVQAPAYCGLHTARWVYVMYSTGAQELYDLSADPFELTNVARRKSLQTLRRHMRARVLAWCRPLPPGFG